MQTLSSASFTCIASESTSECIATVLILSSLQALIILTAISPLFATNIFLNNYDISKRGWPNSTASPFLTKIDSIIQSLSDFISLKVFIASIKQIVSPFLIF